jgi:hypothetical protein
MVAFAFPDEMYSLTLKKKVVNMATQDGGADTLGYIIAVVSKTYLSPSEKDRSSSSQELPHRIF